MHLYKQEQKRGLAALCSPQINNLPERMGQMFEIGLKEILAAASGEWNIYLSAAGHSYHL